MALTVGMTHEKRLKTGPEHSAQKFFSEVPDVFGTPFLGGLFEGVSAALMDPHLGDGETSVGISMNLKHTAPTPLGMEVRAVTEITQVDGRKITFKVEGFDEKEKIGEAVHERFIIDAAKFNKRVEGKKKLNPGKLSLDFPYDLVTLGHFEAGGGWEAQIRQYVRKKYRQDLAGLAGIDPQALAGLFRGELVAGRPYATIQWVLRLAPFRPLELFLLFDQDPEFGTDLRVFYARKSLAVPTEDAYVFAWDYVALLARYGRGQFPLTHAGPGPEWLPFGDFAPDGAGPMQDVSLGAREEILARVTPEVVEVAVRRMDCGTFAQTGGSWEVTWPLLGDLSFRFRYGPAGSEMAFDSHGARKYGPEFLMSLTWLYINGLLRECRQVDNALPKLSAYF